MGLVGWGSLVDADMRVGCWGLWSTSRPDLDAQRYGALNISIHPLTLPSTGNQLPNAILCLPVFPLPHGRWRLSATSQTTVGMLHGIEGHIVTSMPLAAISSSLACKEDIVGLPYCRKVLSAVNHRWYRRRALDF
jgi:hypothetical protein